MTNFIFYANPTLTLVCLPAGMPVRRSLATIADESGIHPDLVRHYCLLGLLGPERTMRAPEPTFDDDALYTLRRIDHYRRHHGVNRQALVLLCALERDVERLERELRFLRGP
jgi:DNA-binding transcriptional MerR regulator